MIRMDPNAHHPTLEVRDLPEAAAQMSNSDRAENALCYWIVKLDIFSKNSCYAFATYSTGGKRQAP
jgi:hypothetical protein